MRHENTPLSPRDQPRKERRHQYGLNPNIRTQTLIQPSTYTFTSDYSFGTNPDIPEFDANPDVPEQTARRTETPRPTSWTPDKITYQDLLPKNAIFRIVEYPPGHQACSPGLDPNDPMSGIKHSDLDPLPPLQLNPESTGPKRGDSTTATTSRNISFVPTPVPKQTRFTPIYASNKPKDPPVYPQPDQPMEPTRPSPRLRKPRLVRQTNTPVRSPPPVIRTAMINPRQEHPNKENNSSDQPTPRRRTPRIIRAKRARTTPAVETVVSDIPDIEDCGNAFEIDENGEYYSTRTCPFDPEGPEPPAGASKPSENNDSDRKPRPRRPPFEILPESDPDPSDSSSSSSSSSSSDDSSLSDSSDKKKKKKKSKKKKSKRKSSKKDKVRRNQKKVSILFSKLCKAAGHHDLKTLKLDGNPIQRRRCVTCWIEIVKDVLRTHHRTAGVLVNYPQLPENLDSITNHALGSFLRAHVAQHVKDVLSGIDPEDGIGILHRLQNMYAHATIQDRN